MPTSVAKKYQLALFVFRRDLRLTDNTGLLAALQNATKVLPCFILDPRQCKNNAYKSKAALQFMYESLQDLQQQLQNNNGYLYLFYGQNEKIISQLLRTQAINAVYVNKDYTPFSKHRDQVLKLLCNQHQVDFYAFEDSLLHAPALTLKTDGTPYQIFSRFYNKAKSNPVALPQRNNYNNYFTKAIPFAKTKQIFDKLLPRLNVQVAATGGRAACLKQLKYLKHIKNYTHDHHYPGLNATSGLSPHLKFTTCSVREIYYAIKKYMTHPESILRELYWRDFFTQIAYYFPHVFGNAFHKKYNQLWWENNKNLFKAWCKAETGFPIVDAGMRELNQTGIMHNRVRLITASFLVKDLHIDWRWGEKYFAQTLVDYDPAVNNGNWQWVAGTGVDAQPYFRIFNPWLQQKKFDVNCEYIKKWLPELKLVANKIIHHWYETKYDTLIINYPRPIISHAVEVQKTKKIYSKIRKES